MWRTTVGHLMQSAADTPALRATLLAKLKQILVQERAEITQMILAEHIDSFLSDIIKFLLTCFKDLASRQKCCECLSELGAIDPGRLDINLLPDFNCEEPEKSALVKRLTEDYLFKLLKKAVCQAQAGYAIQELFHECGCTGELVTKHCSSQGCSRQQPDERDRGALALWNSFRPDVRDSLNPYLSSKYSLRENATQPDLPIFKQKIEYRSWVVTWTAHLIGVFHTLYLGNQENRKLACSPIFYACRQVISYDIDTALFILPLLVLNVIRSGTTEMRNDILAEINAVLEGCKTFVDHPKHTVSINDDGQLCTQEVFYVVAWLTKWAETTGAQASARARVKRTATAATRGSAPRDQDVAQVVGMLSQIQQLQIAKASLNYKAYARSLMHLENHLRTLSKQQVELQNQEPTKMRRRKHEVPKLLRDDCVKLLVSENAEFLQKIFCGLDDPDSLSGLARLRQKTSLCEQILDHESTGEWNEALTCYEQACQYCASHSTDYKAYLQGRLKCLRNLGRWGTMLSLITSEVSQPSASGVAIPSELVSYGVQASWRLGDWARLESFLAAPTCPSDWECSLGRCLLSLQSESVDFTKNLAAACGNLTAPLTAASCESYQRAYPSLVKLHILQELEQAQRYKNASAAEVWRQRLAITQPSFKIQEQILNVRRLMCRIFRVPEEEATHWLSIAKTARCGGQFQIAYNALQQAIYCNGLTAAPANTQTALKYRLEEAKLAWAEGRQIAGITLLKKAMTSRFAEATSSCDDSYKETVTEVHELMAKVCVTLGKWTQQTGNAYHSIMPFYIQATIFNDKWEKGHFYLAKFMDSNLVYFRDTQSMMKVPVEQIESQCSDLVKTLSEYGKALTYGHCFLFYSLSRLLTFWFNFGYHAVSWPEGLHGESSSKHVEKQKVRIAQHISSVMQSIDSLTTTLPSYVWLCGLPQLISRICHRNATVYNTLSVILQKVLTDYPQQTIWQMIALCQSQNALRRQRAEEILHGCDKRDVPKLYHECSRLCKQLLTLCTLPLHCKASGSQKMTMSSDPALRPLLDMHDLSLIVPLQRYLTASLPASGKTDRSFSPFPSQLPTLKSICDEFTVIRSLTKPRKVTLTTSLGAECPFLCKPRDDLRRDARLMEIATVVNKLLKNDPDARKRKLYLRTYAVIPLNEECGLIEWVEHTNGLRPIVSQLLGDSAIQASVVRSILDPKNPDTFDIVLHKQPPIFYKWFLQTFPEPSAWFEARQTFTHTVAVMSMLGYIVGLGDRHGENILIDLSTGAAVHVDFNCLFWKGEKFELPERVPYRLTPNIVDAFGLLRYEGVFRRVAEITLGLMRVNTDTLVSVLETLVYDPLVEWGREQHDKSPSETENVDAVTTIRKIASVLKGRLDKSASGSQNCFTEQLSVEAQVNQTIEAATSKENLVQMYIGWASWI
eukprot:TRINITY_DN170_c0_g1_i2.p1 TRINITY_DN170_c0_g1~~TRINITY_DN170_c0_g1_i2.p1  ORF type:complete len:1419 (-),score=311.12 TRINITY_DN170_c0_g1_i2:111-4367(-)